MYLCTSNLCGYNNNYKEQMYTCVKVYVCTYVPQTQGYKHVLKLFVGTFSLKSY